MDTWTITAVDPDHLEDEFGTVATVHGTLTEALARAREAQADGWIEVRVKGTFVTFTLPAPDAAPLTPADVLEAHRGVWDMPMLTELRPDIFLWLAERFDVQFGMMSDVIIVDRATGYVTGYPTTDVREALDRHLVALTALSGS